LSRYSLLITSDLVTVLASDDTLEPSSLEKRMKLLETHPEWRVVYSDVAFMNDTGELLGRYSQMMPELQPSGNVFGVLLATI